MNRSRPGPPAGARADEMDADTVHRELSIARKAIGWWQRLRSALTHEAEDGTSTPDAAGPLPPRIRPPPWRTVGAYDGG
ncbi:hypothetical protein ABT001_07785 [Streptomyces sp. NPDC002793]|uniref:hypothetical protein n=1 Tax=Streptomyces sp. NPDC002793 TaxID=3154432 RepID=UPI0033272CB4